MLFRSLRVFGYVFAGRGVFAIKISVVPAFGMAGQGKSREMEGGRTAPLDCNTPVRTQSMALTVLGVTVEGFKKERKARFYLEKHLAVNYVVGDVEDGIWRKVKRRKAIVGQDPPKEVRTRGTHAPGYMI